MMRFHSCQTIFNCLYTVPLLKNGCENYHVSVFENAGLNMILIQREYNSVLSSNIYQYALLYGSLPGKLTGSVTKIILNSLPFYLLGRGEVSVFDSPVHSG